MEGVEMSSARIASQRTDFPAWYGDVVRQADLAEHGLVRGTMVIKPYGWAIWEAVQRALDERIRATGHENVYFPLLVPGGVLAREGELVEGFAPEVAVVTRAGGRELDEPLVVRPTSEATVWATYARWIRSYRDLPLRLNQWANVVRWELRPRLFLRTTEFLWQEGHTAHETAAEAVAEALEILSDVYADVAERALAMPVLRGRKSARERFPAAVETYTIEALMRDGKALQAGTSHYLGQSFARAYGVRFTDRSGEERYAYATSWGASTRLVGGIVMTHGDDRGLRLPPAVAPHQAVVVPIAGAGDGGVAEAAATLAGRLAEADVRVHQDARERRPGWKFAEWELRGAPTRAELGARDLADGVVTLVRRDTGGRERVPVAGAPARARALLDEIQAGLLAEAVAFRDEHTLTDPATYEELRAFLAEAGGFAVAGWCGDAACEERVKLDARATIRCLALEPGGADGACAVCGRPATERATWAQAY
jgi:prolyl-tRNA synthetase